MQEIDPGERPAQRGELAAWYERLLEQQAKSGLSVADFATRVGISAWSLYRWRRRLSQRGGWHDEQAPRLVEVAVKRERGRVGHLRVRLRSGHRVDVPTDFDDAELRRLIGVLESC